MNISLERNWGLVSRGLLIFNRMNRFKRNLAGLCLIECPTFSEIFVQEYAQLFIWEAKINKNAV